MWAGVLGPVLFITVFLFEGAVRSGYDPVRMQVSYLSLGERGPIQVASFLVTAGLLGVFAIQLRGRMRTSGGPGAQGVPVAIGVTALGLLVAGLFSTMPAFGYPPGTPDGFPADIPPSAYLHVLGAFLFFGGMIAAPALMARALPGFRRNGLGRVLGCYRVGRGGRVRGVVCRWERPAVRAGGRRTPATHRHRRGSRVDRRAGGPGASPRRTVRLRARGRPTGVDARGYMGCSPLSRFPAPAPLTPVEVTCP